MSDPWETLAKSGALWNRSRLDLASDEILAQLLDRGSSQDWRALYRLMQEPGDAGAVLRRRVQRILYAVPTGRPWFWLAALASLGEPVDMTRAPAVDPGWADI